MGNGASVRPKEASYDDDSSDDDQHSIDQIRPKQRIKHKKTVVKHYNRDNHHHDDEIDDYDDDEDDDDDDDDQRHKLQKQGKSANKHDDDDVNINKQPSSSHPSSSSPVKKLIITSPILVSHHRSNSNTIIIPPDSFDGVSSSSMIQKHDDDDDDDDDDDIIIKKQKKIPVSYHHPSSSSSGSSSATSSSSSSGSSSSSATTSSSYPSSSSGSSSSNLSSSSSSGSSSSSSATTTIADDDDTSSSSSNMDILFQFIPYYNHGNALNDSTVRSSLSSLSIADIDYKDEHQNTLLLLACQYHHDDLVRIILYKGGDANAINNYGVTPLHYACYKESLSYNIAKQLLQAGANPETREYSYGCTPLHYAAGSGEIEICKLLISYGADIMCYDYYNYTSVDYAKEVNNVSLVLYLTHLIDKKTHHMISSSSYQHDDHHISSSSSGSLSSSSMEPVALDTPDWMGYVDPASNNRYYMNIITGESLWEQDFIDRMKSATSSSESSSSGSSSTSSSTSSSVAMIDANIPIPVPKESSSPRLTPKASLPKSPFSSDMTITKKPSYHSSSSSSLNMMIKPSSSSPLSSGSSSSPSGSSSSNMMLKPSSSYHNLSSSFVLSPSSHSKIISDLKRQHDDEMNKMMISYHHNISEKQGIIAKLTSDIDMMMTQKMRLEYDKNEMMMQLDKYHLHNNNDVIKLFQEKIISLQDDNDRIRRDYDMICKELSCEKEKYDMMISSSSSSSDTSSSSGSSSSSSSDDKMMHDMMIHDIEVRYKQHEQHLISQHRDHIIILEANEKMMRQQLHDMKTSYDDEMMIMASSLSSYKSSSAEKMMMMELEVSSSKQKMMDMMMRCDDAEERMKMMQADVDDARVMRQQNIQLHKDLAREQQARRRLHNEMEDLKGKIRVYVRIRPQSRSEIERSCHDAVFKDGKVSVMVKGLGNNNDSKKTYDFDQVFGGEEGNSQEDVFRDTKHLMMSVVDGYNVCIFAYGQTGAGKSFTMIGAADIATCLHENGDFDELAGITPRAVSELFRILSERDAQITYEVQVQMFQLYRDNLEDLLYDRNKIKFNQTVPDLKIILAEHSSTGLVQVDGAISCQASSAHDVMKIFARGAAQRTTSSTKMNQESSRSHLICCLVVQLTNRRTGTTSIGKLTLVDLAGSERIDKSGAVGDTLKEAQSINKSLSALGDVISALTTNQPHIPYRNHPLTMLMSDSIGGNSKTLMFINTSPADYNISESNNSLSFGSRCKDVSNAGASNPAIQQAQLNALKKELNRLKKAAPINSASPSASKNGGLARPV